MKKHSDGKRIRKHHYRLSLTKTTNFSCLPEEILLQIIQHLYLPEVEVLSKVCQRLRITCAESLHHEQEIARNNIRELRLDSSEYGYHDFLLRILKHEINPNYVRRLNCLNVGRYPPFNEQDETINVAQYIGWTSADIQLVRAAIVRSPWLKNIESPDELIARMLQGIEDPVLALMVPMLKNLCLFAPPGNAPTLMQSFVKIARLQCVAEIEDPDLWQRLPLRKLHTIYGYGSSHSFHPISLPEIVHYMSLPSVQRVYLDAGCDTQSPQHERAMLRELEGKGIPRSRASTVFIRVGEMWRNIAELFVDHIRGPCVIRQFMYEPIPNEVEAQESWVAYRLMEDNVMPEDPMSYYWDHCIISGERDPITRQWREELRSIQFEVRYRDFHYESDPFFNLPQYEEDLRQAGVVTSPKWMDLVKWNNYIADPLLDIDFLELE